MKRVFTVHAAKTNLSRLIERARAGEEVIIARGKTPVVRLVPVSAPEPRRRFGAMKGRAATTPAFFEPLPPGELASWTGSGDA
jgi:prevent-host-death family protein